MRPEDDRREDQGPEGRPGEEREAPAAERPTRPEEREDQEAREADRQHYRELQRARWAKVAKTIVALVLLAILIIFVANNTESVEVDFVFFQRQPPLIWVMFGCAVVGGLVGYLIGRPTSRTRLHRKRED